ncbi:sensor histidine kinase [Desulforamulus aquiferis]|uniref:histidine kinase n=1 Tax=Desulforamulus aquiferis TaxID=1397668 RepID=A0AAW7ZDI8_9FIRM|nr:HAMP domain-containing sensor histidine kinase [Desulforamulus aquiferis]MDO7787333.1 HAMP domain-containing sensor histidine kinase [Desulforamulus aquiferis]RYD04936.1 integral membrane sensor signal transduction histidine kinase [Desulforamulus aquiferis]
MIIKLRRKFILVNMALVSLVLLIVFGTIFISNYQRLQAESRDALHRVIEQGMDMPPPKPEIGRLPPGRKPFPITPVFSVFLDQNNTIVYTTQQNVSVSDDVLAKAVEKVLASDYPEGILHDLNLRFMRRDLIDGTKIAFADRTHEINSMQSLFLTSLVVGAGGLLAFFFISLFLSSLALRPAERAWEQQRQFVANASHELRMPLTVILANISILLANRQDPIRQQIKWVENTRLEALRMKMLVDDLLFLAKSDAAHVPLAFSDLNLSNIVWSCLLPFEPVAFEQGVTINANIEPDISLQGNESQIKQLIGILLDNACKYADEKGIVTVTLGREQKKVTLRINNTGTPISAEDLPHIFERFYRADKSRARELGGYGLGLAIAKSIVENHHAKITADSTENLGTTFTVNFSYNN